ncbi:MAG: FISUMP domain-containing protein [Reichenbachiella sp.]|uniref:FISUMP domain-containing protein n=2 Tax=Reichenbachiella sp. TaxID=2184521 RepID=UPI003265A6B8
MNKIVWFFALCLPLNTLAQSEVLVDQRDDQSYGIGEVNGQIWMLENLNLETDLSKKLSTKEEIRYPQIKGRWYHMNELDSICPVDWRLPTADDWIGYFDLLSKMTGAAPKINSRKADITITKFSRHFDLFTADNPLNIVPAGIFQGSVFMYAPESADYWLQNLTTEKREQNNKGYKPVKISYPGKSHIHLFNEFTVIHSHDHHLELDEMELLRRFLIRCIKEDQ